MAAAQPGPSTAQWLPKYHCG